PHGRPNRAARVREGRSRRARQLRLVARRLTCPRRNPAGSLAPPRGDVYISVLLSPPPEETPPTSSPSPDSSRGPEHGRLTRYISSFVGIRPLPFALASASVPLLQPAANDFNPSALPRFVKDQPIPTGIVLFTVFAMVLWRFRHELPLAAAFGVAGRKDLPA